MGRFNLMVGLCLVLVLSGGARAEVAVGNQGDQVMVLVLGITEGPDPIPQVLWQPVRDGEPETILNPDGGVRGDGRPDIAVDADGSPHVVWAYHDGIDYDIAYATWTGASWSETEFLSSTADNDLDPRIFVGDGAIYVVWWQEGSGDLFLASRPHGAASWGIPELLDAGPGRRPSMVRFDDSILIAAEDPQGEVTDIVISADQGGNLNFESETVESIGSPDPLDVVLHAYKRTLWMDWRHSATEFAYSVYLGGGWSPAVIVPWSDLSWTGQEQARLFIRSQVLSD